MLPLPSPLTPATPVYPVHLQALRVTGGTVPGPSGYMSSSVLGPSLYIAFVQQLDTITLLLRDREPCLVVDMNRYGLAPGYYLGRLASSWNSLPVYEVGGSPVTPNLALSSGPLGTGGLTAAHIQGLSTLTPDQLAVLANLNICQLQTLLTALPISQIHTLTLTLTPTQLTNLVTLNTPDQLTALYNQLTTSQTIALTTALTQDQVYSLTQVLTPAQIQTLVTELSTAQLQALTTLDPAVINLLVDNLTTAQVISYLSISPGPGSATYYPPVSTPPTPAAGVFVYVDAADAVFKMKDSLGNISIMTGGGEDTEASLVAAGTNQGTAAAIVTDRVEVTGADGTKGVILPDEEGAIVFVWNNGASNLNVYPPSGARLGNAAVNDPLIVSGTQIGPFVRLSATQWTYLLSFTSGP